ncbi:unnamed protein product [Cylindrotheca closterium]|uniref:Uncharacterized protein n=1 Tax=Cylindrotheca closterium TaxID=2856 RepID=A0AAD2FZZ9_9STRA|nr:unnamed protein product [Cylindrotheca closterium]
MSEYFAKLGEGGPDDHLRTHARNGPASHDEATIQSAPTTSGASTGTRRRKNNRSSSLSGEAQSGQHHEQHEAKSNRRRRRKSVQKSLDLALGHSSEKFENSISHSIAASIASAPTVQHHVRRSGRRSGPGSKRHHVSLSPKRNSEGQPRSTKRSLSPHRATGGSRAVQRSISPTNRQVSRDNSRGARRRSREKSPGQQSPSRSLRGGRKINMHDSVSTSGVQRSISPTNRRVSRDNSRGARRRSREKSPGQLSPSRSLRGGRQSNLHDSVSTSGMMSLARSAATEPTTRKARHSRSPHRLGASKADGASVTSPGTASTPKSRSMSPLIKGHRGPSALVSLLEERKEPEQRIRTRGQHTHDSNQKHKISDQERKRRHSHDNSRHAEGAGKMPKPPNLPQRVQSDIIGGHANDVNHKHKISNKEKVRRHSHDNSLHTKDHPRLLKPTASTRKIMDSVVKVLSLNQQRASVTSMFSEDDWGESPSFSEAFKPEPTAPPTQPTQRVTSKSHRMKVEEVRRDHQSADHNSDRRRSRSVDSSTAQLHSMTTATSSESVMSRQKSARSGRRNDPRSKSLDPAASRIAEDGPFSSSSSPFAVMPVDRERLAGPRERWGRDASFRF